MQIVNGRTQAISKFTAATAGSIKDLLEERLAGLERDFGIKVEITPKNYSAADVHFSGVARLVSSEDGGKTGQQIEFERLATSYGLTAADWRKRVIWGGKAYRLVGFNPQAHKYPFNGELESTGKTYRLPQSFLPEAAKAAGFTPLYHFPNREIRGMY